MTDQNTPRDRRFSGRQITTMVAAVCVAVLASPLAAWAVVGSFSSSSSSIPAVYAKNTASGSGAKAVYGNAAGTSGTEYGVYGRSGSTQGYGVYSAGRIGSSGVLVCTKCVTGADVNAATLPTVPDSSRLGGHAPSYFARIVPLSWIQAPDTGVNHELADVGGLILSAECVTNTNSGINIVSIGAATDTAASSGTLNGFVVGTSSAGAFGFPLSTTRRAVADANGPQQVEGTATYRNNATRKVVTVSFHLYGGPNCEVFGNVLTSG